jgi:hypothetical protein
MINVIASGRGHRLPAHGRDGARHVRRLRDWRILRRDLIDEGSGLDAASDPNPRWGSRLWRRRRGRAACYKTAQHAASATRNSFATVGVDDGRVVFHDGNVFPQNCKRSQRFRCFRICLIYRFSDTRIVRPQGLSILPVRLDMSCRQTLDHLRFLVSPP